MASSITASVGRKGKNKPEDVKIVQQLLNGFASKVKFAKLKVDGTPTGNLEKAIGVFQQEICKFKPDFRVDPGRDTIKKLAAGPAKAEAERKAELKKFVKTIETEHKKMFEQIRKVAEKQASGSGLPGKAAESLYKGVEKFAHDQWEALAGKDPQPDQFDPADIAKMAQNVVKAVEGELKNTVKTAVKAHQQAVAAAQKAIEAQAKRMKSTGSAVEEFIDGVTEFADDVWDAIFGRETGKGGASSGTIPKLGDQLGKELGKKAAEIIKEMEQRQREEESAPDAKVPLILKGAEEDKISSACFKFTVSGKSPDPKSKVLLCLNSKDNNIDITKGYGKTSWIELVKLIDAKSLWGQKVDFFAMETTNGKPDDKTKSNVVKLRTPVEPFKGTISYTGLGADKQLKYTGNGSGRLLSYTKINGWYFFKYGGKFERDPAMRGFDCITYVGTANKVSSGMDGRGDRLADKLGASKVDMEDVSHEKFVEYFKGDGKSGTYICWWSSHCFAVINGNSYEFSQSKKGYFTGKATSYRYKGNKSVRKL